MVYTLRFRPSKTGKQGPFVSSNQLAQKASRTHSLQKHFQIQVILRNRAQTWVGTKMAPACTSIFMGTLESRILYERNPSPTHWKDDIFLVWTDTKESLEQFIKSINGLHPCINFTGDYFQQLKTRSYTNAYTKGRDLPKFKPANTQQYVHASTAHTPGTGWSIMHPH